MPFRPQNISGTCQIYSCSQGILDKDIYSGCWTKWRCLFVRRQDTEQGLGFLWNDIIAQAGHDLSDVGGKLRPIHQRRNTELFRVSALCDLGCRRPAFKTACLESLELMPPLSNTLWCWWRYWGLDLLCYSIAVCLSGYATVLLCSCVIFRVCSCAVVLLLGCPAVWMYDF